MSKLIAAGLISLMLTLGGVTAALAAPPPAGVECDTLAAPTAPGGAATAHGSAFNEDGTGHKAYEAAGAPSRYDNACFEFSRR